MKKRLFVLTALAFLLAACSPDQTAVGNDRNIRNFEECAAAGNPVMESYPRQCKAGNETFIEELPRDKPSGQRMDEARAKLIAESTCVKGGETVSPGAYDSARGVWLFEANLNTVREGCDPFCAVSEETGKAVVEWRCGGMTLAEELAGCLPKSDMASKEKCERILGNIRNYDECVNAGFQIQKSNPPQCSLPDGRVFTQTTDSSWGQIISAVESCQAEKAFQDHSRIVKVRMKDGSEMTAAEPEIDEIIAIAEAAEPVCGRLPIATE